MKTTRIMAATAWLGGCMAAEAPAQPANTEVMAESSTNLIPSFRGPDRWVLTNFGIPNVAVDNSAWRPSNASNDVKSPGYTSGPITLRIPQRPLTQIVD